MLLQETVKIRKYRYLKKCTQLKKPDERKLIF